MRPHGTGFRLAALVASAAFITAQPGTVCVITCLLDGHLLTAPAMADHHGQTHALPLCHSGQVRGGYIHTGLVPLAVSLPSDAGALLPGSNPIVAAWLQPVRVPRSVVTSIEVPPPRLA